MDPDDGARPPLVLVDANWQAKPLIALLETTPALHGAVEFRHFEQRPALEAFLASRDANLVRVAAIVQQVTDFWTSEARQPLAGRPAQAGLLRFPFLEGDCFWPLSGSDPRLRGDPPLYPDGRYRFSDKIAAALADRGGDDDSLYGAYLEQSGQALGDPDPPLIAAIARMAERDAQCDVPFTLFFVQHYRTTKLFHAPACPTGASYGWLGAQLARSLGPLVGGDPAALAAAVERHADGLIGVGQFQFPVHPLVARRFGLSWATPEATVRFGKNAWTHRQAMLQAIRWLPWAP